MQQRRHKPKFYDSLFKDGEPHRMYAAAYIPNDVDVKSNWLPTSLEKTKNIKIK